MAAEIAHLKAKPKSKNPEQAEEDKNTFEIKTGQSEKVINHVMTPLMVGSTWPRVRSTLESDCLPALFQGTVLFRLVMD